MKWSGDVWVATWGDGGLVYVTLEKVGSTADGQRFQSFNVSGVRSLVKEPPTWR